MEILVTIVAFWLILVGAYGAYSLTQERNKERAPRVRPQRQVNLTPAPAGPSGPFGPVSLPVEKVPSFIARVAPALPEPQAYDDIEEQLPEDASESARFRAERIIAVRVQQLREPEEPAYESPPPVAPRRQPSRRREPQPEPARFEMPSRPVPSEVDFLRAQVEHLRSEINALSTESTRKVERPQQRRYQTGNYTHLPRTLRRQVNEVRGYRRFSSN